MFLYISKCFFVPNLLGGKSHLFMCCFNPILSSTFCCFNTIVCWGPIIPGCGLIIRRLMLFSICPRESSVDWCYICWAVYSLVWMGSIHFCCGNSALNQQIACSGPTFQHPLAIFKPNVIGQYNNIRNAVWLLLLIKDNDADNSNDLNNSKNNKDNDDDAIMLYRIIVLMKTYIIT